MEEIDNEEDLELELLQDELEYLQLMSHFFENQTKIWGELVNKVELRQKESLEEEQALIDKLNEGQIEKVKLISRLKTLKAQVKVSANSSNNGKEAKQVETIVKRINGFFNCLECHYKSTMIGKLNRHTKAIHRKLQPFKCTDCGKGLFDTFNLLQTKYIYYIL